MLDPTTKAIEEIYLELGSYAKAFIAYAETYEIDDYKDILKVISPILVEKIKNEFIEGNFVPSMKKKKNNFSDIFSE